MNDRLILTISVLGGTGKEGQALAYRWAKAGYHVILGSRSAERAADAAAALNERLGKDLVRGMANDQAAAECDIAVLTVPYAAHRQTLEALKDRLRGKVLVDVTVPLVPPKVSTVQMPSAGSATQEAQQILGAETKVVAAFQNVSHEHLSEDHPLACDVLVCGDSQEARDQVLQLVEAAGLLGWDAGPAQNAVVVEGLTSVLIGINKRYRLRGAGIRILGERTSE